MMCAQGTQAQFLAAEFPQGKHALLGHAALQGSHCLISLPSGLPQETADVNGVMHGDLQPFMQAFLKKQGQQRSSRGSAGGGGGAAAVAAAARAPACPHPI